MTEIKARKTLGISKTACIKSAEQVYRQQQQKLHLRMVPGNPCSSRQQAQVELAQLTEAWNVLNTNKPKVKQKPMSYKPTHGMNCSCFCHFQDRLLY